MIADTIIKPCADSEFLTTNWEFALFELARTHYAAICIGEEAIVPGLVTLIQFNFRRLE